MGKVKNCVNQWCSDFNDRAIRKRFVRHLKRRNDKLTTPWWESSFNMWLVYEATIHPVGLELESIDRWFVTLHANCEGVQSEGICLKATFKIPLREFKLGELLKMIESFQWFPDDADHRIAPEFITELSWWYDAFYDDTV